MPIQGCDLLTEVIENIEEDMVIVEDTVMEYLEVEDLLEVDLEDLLEDVEVEEVEDVVDENDPLKI